MTVVTNSRATGILSVGPDSNGNPPAGGIGVTAGGILTSPLDSSALASARLAARPATRGKRRILVGGSETARGCATRLTTTTGVVLNAATQIASVNCTTHLLHTGAEVFVASENATAPSQQGGAITVMEFFTYGQVTVVDSNNFTVPYWSALPAGSPYLALNGTSTANFSVMKLAHAAPPSKFNELNHWLGNPFEFVLSVATGSSSSTVMVERIPALVTLAQQGAFDELSGSFGLGDTALWAASHSWTVAQLVAQCRADILAFAYAMAPYGVTINIELIPAQLNSSGLTIAGVAAVHEMLRELASDPALRISLEDEMLYSMDPATGLVRARYQLNGTNNVHPGAEGCKYYASRHADQDVVGGNHYPNQLRLAASPLDNFKSDATSLQLFDPLVSTTTTVTAASVETGSLGKVSGNVPELVTIISTTGNAGRSGVFSYEQCGEYWHMYALLTAAAAGDTFTIGFTNPPGARLLSTQILALAAGWAAAGNKLFVGCDFSFQPSGPTVWTSIDTYFGAKMSYGGGTVNNYQAYLAADTVNSQAYPDGPLTDPRLGPAFMKPFTIPADVTAVSLAGLTFVATAAAAGTGILRVTMPTCRIVLP